MYVAVVLEVASNDESVEPLRMIKIDMIESFRVKKKIEEKKSTQNCSWESCCYSEQIAIKTTLFFPSKVNFDDNPDQGRSTIDNSNWESLASCILIWYDTLWCFPEINLKDKSMALSR